jgi:hypothetical protein
MIEKENVDIATSMLTSLLGKDELTFEESEYAFKLLSRIIHCKNNDEIKLDLSARLPRLYFEYNDLSILKIILPNSPEFISVAEKFGVELGKQLFLLLESLKQSYNHANILGYHPHMDDLYTISDFAFTDFLDYVKAGSQQQEIEKLDMEFEKNPRHRVPDNKPEFWDNNQFATLFRAHLKDKQPGIYLELLKSEQIYDLTFHWTEEYEKAVNEAVGSGCSREEATEINLTKFLNAAIADSCYENFQNQ